MAIHNSTIPKVYQAACFGCSVVLVGQLVDNADLPQERKEPVKKDVLHLKFSASSSTDKAFCSLIEKQLTEQGLSVADSNALLAELASMSD
ncbi:TPA: hypothetical protein ACH3X1_007986 [Trebouxia sp. C0004]